MEITNMTRVADDRGGAGIDYPYGTPYKRHITASKQDIHGIPHRNEHRLTVPASRSRVSGQGTSPGKCQPSCLARQKD